MSDTYDNILNVLLAKELIELPPMIKHKFPNGVPHNFHCEKFCSYHHSPNHLTWNCRTLKNIIQDFIEKGAINMDPIITTPIGPIHLNNAQHGVFTNPLPSFHTLGCIGNVGIFGELGSFFINNHHCRHS